MRLSYDDEVDAAYLRLREETDDIGLVTSEVFRPPNSEDQIDEFVLDFDREGRLVGIEILRAKRRLLPSVLARAHRHG